MGKIAIGLACAVTASAGGAAIAQFQSQPVYNAMGAYASGMMNAVALGQPLAFQARNARMKAEAQRGAAASDAPVNPRQLTFAPGDGAQTVKVYVARISRQDPTAGGQLSTALAGKNIPAIFGDLVRPYGLNSYDVADAMAAHLIMRTMVATGAQPPSVQGVRNVRDSVAQALAHDPKIASQDYRSQIGGGAQLDFVLVNRVWREIGEGKWPAGTAAQYRHNIAASLASEGINLDTMRLTSDGFVSK